MSSGDDETPQVSNMVPFVTHNAVDAQFMATAIKQCELLTNNDFDETFEELKRNFKGEEGSSSSRQKGKRKKIDRGRVQANERLWNDYFSASPVYDEDFFRRTYRMSKPLFLLIVECLSNHSPYFTQRTDVIGRPGLSPLQKCTSVIRQLAYGTTADQCDEYIRLGESTSIQCLRRFCRCVIEVFSERYWRRPNADDIQNLIERHSTKHGFPGILGSIDCMHWGWKNCLVAWKGQYTRGDHGYPTIMLEAVASQDLWIWHAYFGVAGSINDINVINQSPIFNQILEGNAPPCNFIANDTQYTTGYYLADGIYPEWSTIVKSFTQPRNPKIVEFTKHHESARKDMERAFGVLQSHFHIVRGPARPWSAEVLSDIMYACVVLHNMIIEDEGNGVTYWSDDEDEDTQPANHGPTFDFVQHISRFKKIRNSEAHHALRADLMKHIWSLKNA